MDLPGRPRMDDKKERFDAIAELWKNAWRILADRRTVEWRVSFTLWTALGSCIALIATGKISPITRCAGYTVSPIAVVGIVLSVLFGLHFLWLCELNKRHSLDRDMAFHYEDRLRELCNAPLPDKLKKSIDKNRKSKCVLDWGQVAQLVVTALLSILAFGVICIMLV
jgi:hypothetical protein